LKEKTVDLEHNLTASITSLTFKFVRSQSDPSRNNNSKIYETSYTGIEVNKLTTSNEIKQLESLELNSRIISTNWAELVTLCSSVRNGDKILAKNLDKL